ncbi:hypothetical protein [Natronorarus salvus]|uniref:hypothetical protein n=1 Tax=Natronorarus salvus TaxID=3117733 RepID=UPI002F26B503
MEVHDDLYQLEKRVDGLLLVKVVPGRLDGVEAVEDLVTGEGILAVLTERGDRGPIGVPPTRTS